MNGRYRLGGLEDDQLLAALSGLVRRENDSLSDLLAHLAELDERGLCVALGYSSLFAYCREALGFCKSSAGRRIAAARVCRKYPQAFERVANGELQLSVLCALGQYLTSENAAELFVACSRKSYEQVEVLLAVRFPKADVRDLIRRLPARTVESTPDIGTSRAAASEASTGAAPSPPRTPDVRHAAQIQPAPRETAQTAPPAERSSRSRKIASASISPPIPSFESCSKKYARWPVTRKRAAA